MQEIINAVHKVFSKKFFEVVGIYDGGDAYLIAIKSRQLPKDEVPLDPWYTMEKKNKQIRGFQPHMNKEWFNKALQKPIMEFKMPNRKKG